MADDFHVVIVGVYGDLECGRWIVVVHARSSRYFYAEFLDLRKYGKCKLQLRFGNRLILYDDQCPFDYIRALVNEENRYGDILR
jgi:hypothetical protein